MVADQKSPFFPIHCLICHETTMGRTSKRNPPHCSACIYGCTSSAWAKVPVRHLDIEESATVLPDFTARIFLTVRVQGRSVVPLQQTQKLAVLRQLLHRADDMVSLAIPVYQDSALSLLTVLPRCGSSAVTVCSAGLSRRGGGNTSSSISAASILACS